MSNYSKYVKHPRIYSPPDDSGLPEHAGESLNKAIFEKTFYTNLEELQNRTFRILIDPDLSQDRVFRFCAPLVLFACLLFLAVIVPRSVNYSYRILALGSAVFVLSSIVVLRLVIFIIGYGVHAFVDKDLSGNNTRRREMPGFFELVARGGLFST